MKCFAFDLGRVLFDFDYSIALEKIKDKIGVSAEKITQELFYNNFADDFEKGLISDYDFYLKFKNEFHAALDYQEFITIWCDIFTPKYEVIDLVSKLRVIYPVYLISNINELHFNFLHQQYPQVFTLFDGLVLSFRTKSLKPETQIYAELKRMSGRDYEKIIYIDDRQDLIAKAKDLSLNCIKFTDFKALRERLDALAVEILNDYEKNILLQLKNTLRAYKNPLVVGIGNSLRADDALGSKISETIKTQISLKVISAEPSLENYTSSIKKADSDFILFIDAAEIPPDKQFAYFFAQDLANISLHLTHDTSLKTTLEYLQKEKPSDILILGIKGYNYDLGGQMSEPAQRTEKIIENFFIKNFPAHK